MILAWQHQQRRVDELEKKLAIAISALDRLQRLGNAPHIGNSVGNNIAADVLKQIMEMT